MTTFTLPLPPSVNKLYRVAHNRLVLTDVARNYKTYAGLLALQAEVHPVPGDLAVTLVVYRQTKRGDADNFCKACLDCLNGIAWEDDRQIKALHVYLRDDQPKKPRVEVTVKQIAGRVT